MNRKVYDVRIYPGVLSGFDVLVRVRGGLQPSGNHPTLEAALVAAQAIPGKPPAQPVYVYPRSFAQMMADSFAPAKEAMQQGGRQ